MADDVSLIFQMQECERRLLSVWRTLGTQMGNSFSPDQLDQALAHYAYGLTHQIYADRSGSEQINAIISLLAKALPAERINEAIHCKESRDERFEKACTSLTHFGERDALNIIGSNSF